MDEIKTSTPAEERSPGPLSLERLRLRFRDPALESAFRDDRFRHNVANIRFAYLAGIALWVSWGLLLRPHILALSDRRLDMLMRFGVFIPMLIVGFGLTFTPLFRRMWQSASVVIAGATILLWVYYATQRRTRSASHPLLARPPACRPHRTYLCPFSDARAPLGLIHGCNWCEYAGVHEP